MSHWFRKQSGDPDGESLPPDFVREHPLLRQLYYEPRLRVAGLAIFLGFTSLILWFGPVFPVSQRPEGGRGWISGRHWFGFWRAVGAARQSAGAGDVAAAAGHWRRAVANDPNCIHCEREHLAALLREVPPTRVSLTNGTQHALWLLRLGHTNTSDLVLFARLLLHHGEPREAVVLLEPRLAKFNAPEFRVYLEARLAERTFGTVGPAWVTVAPEVRGDPVVHLYELAWRIAWGSAGDAPAARRELEWAGRETTDRGALARVRLELALVAGDSSGAEAAVQELHQLGSDRTGDHVRVANLWRLAGKTPLARARLNQAPRPRSAGEALELADLALAIGDFEGALAGLRDAAPRFDQASLWLRWAGTLVDRGDWAGAGELGRRIREESIEGALLRPYAAFLTGVAAEKSGGTAEAGEAFLELSRVTAGDPQVLWITAGQLVRAGHPREAQPLLSACEPQWGDRAEYWERVDRVALALGDVEGMLTAARRAWQLAPGNPVHADRLAAALITLRRDPGEAVRLTFEAVSARPTDAGFRVHRALALIQFGRDDDGLELLAGLESEGRLDAALRTGVYLGRFEVHARRQELKAALADYKEIDGRELLPPEVLWVESQFGKMLNVSQGEGGTKPSTKP